MIDGSGLTRAFTAFATPNLHKRHCSSAKLREMSASAYGGVRRR